MYARVALVDFKPDEEEKYRRLISEKVIPVVQKQQGAKGGYWLIDSENGKGYGIVLFESKAALDASDEAATRLAEEAPRQGLAKPEFRKCEVIGSLSSVESLAA